MSNWINLLEVVYPIGSIYQLCHLYLGENFLVPEEVLSDDL